MFTAHGGGDAPVEPVRALELRRVDALNWSHTLLGFTRPQLREALVLLEQVDEQIATRVGPSLAPDASWPLFDAAHPAAEPAVVKRVDARAGEIARAELGGAAESASVARLALTLARAVARPVRTSGRSASRRAASR